MSSWEQGRSTIGFLVERGRLEAVAAEGSVEAADRILVRAQRRLETAAAGFDGGDFDGAFVVAYDAYRMAAESLLVRQGLRATGGEGSHVTVEDAVSAQFADQIEAFAKPIFERFRRTRHAAQYFDPDAPEITEADAAWAIDTARSAAHDTRRISLRGWIRRFDLS